MSALRQLEIKMLSRLARYEKKKAWAVGTDKINQGAKIKATIECLQDVRMAMKLEDK